MIGTEAPEPTLPGNRARTPAREVLAPDTDMPCCEMFLDAESLNHVTGASVLGWRAGGALLGCLAGGDTRRRVLLVARNGDSFLISDLEATHGAGPAGRPGIRGSRVHSC